MTKARVGYVFSNWNSSLHLWTEQTDVPQKEWHPAEMDCPVCKHSNIKLSGRRTGCWCYYAEYGSRLEFFIHAVDTPPTDHQYSVPLPLLGPTTELFFSQHKGCIPFRFLHINYCHVGRKWAIIAKDWTLFRVCDYVQYMWGACCWFHDKTRRIYIN